MGYQHLQFLHILFFGILLALPEWKSIARPLLLSAIVYATLEPLLTPYLFDILFDFLVVEWLIRTKNPHGKPQIFLLSLSICFNCLAFWEYPTKYMFIYSHYAIVTNSINLLQLMGAWNGITAAVRRLLDAMGFHDWYLRGILGEAMEAWTPVVEREGTWGVAPTGRKYT